MSHFYPRSPRGERRATSGRPATSRAFLSTLPARGATAHCRSYYQMLPISIHAPREGSDRSGRSGAARRIYFYPRSPRGERRSRRRGRRRWRDFYPRSPRGERRGTRAPPTSRCYFYPRSPRGERRARCPAATTASLFLSTLPARGATRIAFRHLFPAVISIHAPREGSDCFPILDRLALALFLSTLPARGATSAAVRLGLFNIISIHAPREGSDAVDAAVVQHGAISIHAPREGSDGMVATPPESTWPVFLSTLPARGATA